MDQFVLNGGYKEIAAASTYAMMAKTHQLTAKQTMKARFMCPTNVLNKVFFLFLFLSISLIIFFLFYYS